MQNLKKIINEHELPNEQISKIEQFDQLINGLTQLKEAYWEEENMEYGDEIGKILFGVVILSIFFDINAEFALTKSLEKFINRFRYIEKSRFIEGFSIHISMLIA